MLFLKLLNVNEQKYKHATLNISINCCLQPYVKTLLYCRSVQLTFEDKTEFSCKKLGCARVISPPNHSTKKLQKTRTRQHCTVNRKSSGYHASSHFPHSSSISTKFFPWGSRQ